MLEANPNYRGGAPPLKRVVIRHVPEPAAQRLLIEKGDADIARDLTPDQIAEHRGQQGRRWSTAIAAGAAPLCRPQREGETCDNVKVRQALRYLIDYDGMAEFLPQGPGPGAPDLLALGISGPALDENPYNFDPAKAKQLLTEAGYPDGFEITLDAPNSAPYTNIAQSIQSSMAQGGIKVTIIPAEKKPLLTKYRARQHQMLLIYWGPDYMDPHTNADSFARNTDNSDNPATKPLAWRNSWQIPNQQDDGRPP